MIATRIPLLAIACSVVCATREVAAQGTPALGGVEPPALVTTGPEQSAITANWSARRARPFAASTVELGWLYARPRIAIGYGRPHWEWIGAETTSTVSPSYLAQYAGLHAVVPLLDVRVGARYTYSLARGFLPARSSYDRFEIDVVDAAHAQYLAIEGEIAATLPIPTGSIYALATFVGFPGIASDQSFFEESLHVIARGSTLWRGRLGYLIALGRTGAVRIGPLVEVLGVPQRDGVIVRVGIVGSVVLTPTLEIVASLVPQVYGPDSLGLLGGDFSQLGIRWRWATGQGNGVRSILGE
jgi:hypothetical protein